MDLSRSTSQPRILLTGANGQVGWELLRRLQPLGEIVATVHSPTPDSQALGLRSLDLGDIDAIRAAVREVRPRLIVNAAAYTAVDKAESEIERAMAINAVAPGILADEARRLGAAIVHYSTDYVFDGSGDSPWREDSPTGPLNSYGRSKLAGEEAIRASGAAHLVLRTCWVYGIHGKNFVKTMLRLGSTKDELRIVSDQIGAPTSARVIADTTSQIVTQGIHDLPAFFADRGGIVNLACAGETNWHGFAEEIFRQARALSIPLAIRRVIPVVSSDYPTPAVRPKNSRLDLTLLRERFVLAPPDWRTALADAFPLLARTDWNCP